MLPSVTEIISRSGSLYQQHWKLFLRYTLLTFLPVFIFSFVAGMSVDVNPSPLVIVLILIGLIITSIISIWFTVTLVRVIAKAYQGQPIGSMSQEIQPTKKLIIPAILASILSGLIVMGGLILLIVPGIIFAVWFVFTIYAVAIDDQKTVASLSFSKQLVKGRWFEIFWRLLGPGIVFGLMAFIPQSILEIIFAILRRGMGETGTLALQIISVLLSVIISFCIAPLSTSAQTILYVEAKKNPLPLPPVPQS